PPNPSGCRGGGRIVKVRRHRTPGEAAEATPRPARSCPPPPPRAPAPPPAPRPAGLARGHVEPRPGPTGAATPSAGPGLTRRATTVLGPPSRTGTVGANPSTGHRVLGLGRGEARGRRGGRGP